MKINRPKRRRAYCISVFWRSIFLVLLVAATGPVARAFADESISVTCYKLENLESPVGNVVVYDTSRAALSCNSLYYDCKGGCVGCFTDQDYLDSVCVDAGGTMFLK